MNHQKVYDTIVENARFKNRNKLNKKDINYVYYEKHHIFAKCLGGEEEKENLVLLTSKEHYVCHKLLTYIYPGNRKIALAFHRMSYGIHNKYYNCCARDYAYARELVSKTPVSEETCEKISKANKGKKNPKLSNFFKEHLVKYSKETKLKMSLASKGKPKSETHKKNLQGINKGKRHNEETKQKMSKAHKGIKQSEEHKRKGSESRKGDKNGMFGKCLYNIWIEKFGIEEANNRNKLRAEKLSKKSKNRKHSDISKLYMSIAQKNRKKIKCNYCNKEIDPGNFGKYHGEKCKFKN